MPLDLDPIRTRLALDNDFRFLARAREDIAALLSEVDSLRAELKAAQSSLSYVKEDRRQIQATLDNLRYRIERRDIYQRDIF